MEKRLILIAAILFILEVGWLLHKMKIFDVPSSIQEASLGVLSDKVRDVRFKSVNHEEWNEGLPNQTLKAYDTILTLKNSTTTLHLNENIEVSLKENSLVTLEPSSQVYHLGLHLKRGVYTAKITKPMKLRMNNKEVQILGETQIEAAIDCGALKLTTSSKVVVTNIEPDPDVLACHVTPPPTINAMQENDEVEEFFQPQRLDKPSPKPQRKLAQQEFDLTIPMEEQLLKEKTWRKRDFLQVEGASFGMLANTDPNNPALSMFGAIKGRHWLSPSFFSEARVGAKVMGYNPTGKQVAPLIGNSHLHKYWSLPFSLWNAVRSFGLSVFAGGEYYSNTQSNSQNIFVSNYVMAEIGAAMRFDFFDNWDTGGAVSWAYDITGKAQKYEIQGDINYLLQSNWSMGLGYRGRIYEALTARGSADGILPFKEGYMEVFGSLRYWFEP